MASLGEAKVNIRANLKPLRAGLARAKNMVKKAMMGIAAVVKKIGRTIITATKVIAVAVAALGVISVRAFVKFEAAMADVSTMLTEQAMSIMPKYTEQVKAMSVAYGEGTSILAKGLYNILSASVPVDKAIGVLEVSVKAAKAGLTETSEAAYAITGILNAYGLSADKAGQVSDILFATVKRGQTTFSKLAPSIGRVTAISAAAGIGLEEVSAALSTITRGGISTQESIVGLRMALISLQGRSKDAIKVAKDHGIVLSANALAHDGLYKTVEKLKKLSPDVLKDIFREIRARVALGTLMGDMEGFARDYDEAVNSAGKTQEAFNKQAEVLGFKLSRLKQAFNRNALELGTILSPAIELITKDLIKLAEKMTTFYTGGGKEKVALWANKIRNRMIALYTVITDLWKSDKFAGAIQWGLDSAISKFKNFAMQVIEIMNGVVGEIKNMFARMMPTILKKTGRSRQKVNESLANVNLKSMSDSTAPKFGEAMAEKMNQDLGVFGKEAKTFVRFAQGVLKEIDNAAGRLDDEIVNKLGVLLGRWMLMKNKSFKDPEFGEATGKAFAKAQSMTAKKIPLPPNLKKTVDTFAEMVERMDAADLKAAETAKNQSKSQELLGGGQIFSPPGSSGAAGKDTFGLVGLKEMWSKMVTGLGTKDPMVQQVGEQKKTNVELRKNRNLLEKFLNKADRAPQRITTPFDPVMA